jgi:peptidoglycan hydrolase CwlO-like protein
MIQRWDDLTPEEQQRYTDNEQLRALLAERTTALEQLQMALHVKHAQLTTITAERDNYRSKFRDLEHELQLERGQIVAMQQRAEAAEAELADAYETVISLKRSEGYNERAEVERLTTLRPDSEYLRV